MIELPDVARREREGERQGSLATAPKAGRLGSALLLRHLSPMARVCSSSLQSPSSHASSASRGWVLDPFYLPSLPKHEQSDSLRQ